MTRLYRQQVKPPYRTRFETPSTLVCLVCRTLVRAMTESPLPAALQAP
jgi:hypothetical protein